MILTHLVYDAQFSFVTIYKVDKCMINSVLKIRSDIQSRVVYSSLKERVDSNPCESACLTDCSCTCDESSCEHFLIAEAQALGKY